MKKIIAISIVVISIFSIFLLGGCKGEPVDGEYKELAQCLTDKGVKFYGAFWCKFCKDQKRIFGDDMRYINYVECDARGDDANPEECAEIGVKSYPTWYFPGQDLETGVQQPETLARKTNCEDALPGANTVSTSPNETADETTNEADES